MPKGVFELIVMFFELINSLATFQAIINDLLRDIIETEDVAAFIDDVIVGIETEKGHDNIVKEVWRRIVENDLFVKLEKYVWNIREVGFLEAVIRPDRVKIEKENI